MMQVATWGLSPGDTVRAGLKHANFGDNIMPFLLQYFGIHHEIHHGAYDDAVIVGLGSILNQVPVTASAIILGSGFMHEHNRAHNVQWNLQIVRGQLSLSHIEGLTDNDRKNITLGDPALLARYLPRLTLSMKRRFRLGIIPHYHNIKDVLTHYQSITAHPDACVINVLDSVPTILGQISMCDAIVSSSLHGLIVADSLRIPNVHVQFYAGRHDVLGNGFKFRDYYSVFEGISETGHQRVLMPDTSLETILSWMEGYTRGNIEQVINSLELRFKTLAVQLLSQGKQAAFPTKVRKREKGSRRHQTTKRNKKDKKKQRITAYFRAQRQSKLLKRRLKVG